MSSSSISSLSSESSESSLSSLSSLSSESSEFSELSSLSSSSEYISIVSEVVPGPFIDISSGDVPVVSTIDVAKLLEFSSVAVDSNFNGSNKWETITVIYEHVDGQNKKFVHRLRGSSWSATGLFTTFANTGDWLKNRIILTDNEGDMLVIERVEIGDDEDLTITS